MAEVRPLDLEVADRAADQLESIWEYIGARNPRAATKVGRRIRACLELLRRNPYAGRLSRIRGAREWSVRPYPYVIVYRLIGDPPHMVVVGGIFHTAQGTREI